jgi:hypothetical protein
MGSLSRCDETNIGEAEVPGREPTLGWHPSGEVLARIERQARAGS